MSDTPDKGGRPPVHGGYARVPQNPETVELRHQLLSMILDGRPDPSGPESIVAGMCADALLRWGTVNQYLDEHGPLTKNGTPRHVMKVYIGLMNATRRNLEALGLQRPEAKGPSLGEYLASRANGVESAMPAPDSPTPQPSTDGATGADAAPTAPGNGGL